MLPISPRPRSTSFRTTLSLLAGLLVPGVGVLGSPGTSLATPVTSAANIPSSAISPGGVNMATGELILPTRPDLRLGQDGARAATVVTFYVAEGAEIPESPPSGEVLFARYYASMLAPEGLTSGHLGPNWLGTYDWTLSVVGSSATFVTNRGAAFHFAKNNVGSWDLTGPLHAKVRMEEDEAGYDVVVASHVYSFSKNSGLLTAITDARGNALALSYAGDLLQQVTDGLGRALTFGYDANGLLTSVGDGTRTVSFGYMNGLLTSVTDAGGNTWSYTYIPPGPPTFPALLATMTEPLGNTPVAQTYDAMGRVASQTDALNHVATYEYDTAIGNTFTDPVGDTWTYMHDGGARLLSLTDPATGVTSYTYDALGRVATRTRPLGDMASLAYDAQSGYPSALTLPGNVTFGWSYVAHPVGGAALYDLASASYPDGTAETYGRDQAGNLTDFNDRAGHHWTATYNQRGQLLTWSNPAGGTTTFAYDNKGRFAAVTDHAQNTTQYTYDALDRLIQVTLPDLATWSCAYDALDHPTSVIDLRQQVWGGAYDPNGRLVSITDPLQHSTQYVYDALDRLTQVVDPLGHPSIYAYDAAGRLASFTDRTGRSDGFAYDRTQRQVQVIQGAFTTTYHADANDRLTEVGNPLNQAWSLQYDPLDRVTRVGDPLGNGIDYGYDAMGRLTSLTAPLGHMETFGYDPRGLLSSFFDVTSETDYARTPLGQVSIITDPNRHDWSRVHDAQGRLTSASDPLGRTATFGYDSRNRAVQVNRPDGIVEHIVYDPAGPVRIGGSFDGDLANTVANLSYDGAMRLVSATGASFGYDAADRMTSCNGLEMAYDDEGRITSIAYAPGKLVSYAYDARGLVSKVTDWAGGNTTFEYDAASRLISMTRPNGVSTSYQYDAAGRPIQIVNTQPPSPNMPLASVTLTRDALGRATSLNRRQPLMPGVTAPSTTQLAYDAASQIQGFNWDPLGRLVSDGSRAFEWDALSRLTHYTAGADSPRFTYDALGRVLARSQGAQTESYIWNYATMVPTLASINPGPPQLRYFVYTPAGLLLYSVEGSTGARRFYHYDEEGNTSFLTNDSGSVVVAYAYRPYGGVTALGQTAENPFTFGAAVGMMQLGSSGLWAVSGRTYDAITRRVISGGAALPSINPGPPMVVASVTPRPPNAPFALRGIKPGPPNTRCDCLAGVTKTPLGIAPASAGRDYTDNKDELDKGVIASILVAPIPRGPAVFTLEVDAANQPGDATATSSIHIRSILESRYTTGVNPIEFTQNSWSEDQGEDRPFPGPSTSGSGLGVQVNSTRVTVDGVPQGMDRDHRNDARPFYAEAVEPGNSAYRFGGPSYAFDPWSVGFGGACPCCPR